MIIDGKAIAEKIYRELEDERKEFPGEVVLGMLVGDESPVTDSYVRIKMRAAERLGVTFVRRAIPQGATTDEAIEILHALANECDGVIPQLPITSVDSERLCNSLPKEKDVDVLGIQTLEALEERGWITCPPVAAALVRILEESDCEIAGKKVVVVGKGKLVGRPAGIVFSQQGAHVTMLGKGDDVAKHTRDADIVILGAGVSYLVGESDVREGVVLLDAGTSELGGKLVGDADPRVAAKCSIFTPVPGGVGPVAISMIFKNLFALKRSALQRDNS